jgi:hypothetical protein
MVEIYPAVWVGNDTDAEMIIGMGGDEWFILH